MTFSFALKLTSGNIAIGIAIVREYMLCFASKSTTCNITYVVAIVVEYV